METLYLVLMIVFIIATIVSIGLYIFFKLDENNIKVVSNKLFNKLNKTYTKQEFENTMYNQYINIEESKNNNDYALLKDIVSDKEYNNILLERKKEDENNIKIIHMNFQKGFSKLINYKVINNQEVASFWIKYSCLENISSNINLNSNSIKPMEFEYIITYVKDNSSKEEIICPNCGQKIKILLNSKCSICDNTIVPKNGHWVYIGKEVPNIEKNKKN